MREEMARAGELGRRRASMRGFSQWLSEADRRVQEFVRAYR